MLSFFRLRHCRARFRLYYGKISNARRAKDVTNALRMCTMWYCTLSASLLLPLSSLHPPVSHQIMWHWFLWQFLYLNKQCILHSRICQLREWSRSRLCHPLRQRAIVSTTDDRRKRGYHTAIHQRRASFWATFAPYLSKDDSNQDRRSKRSQGGRK